MAGAPQDVTDSVSLNTQNGDTSKVDGVDDVDAVKVVGGGVVLLDNAEEVAAEHAAEQEATLQRLRSELEDEKVEVVEEEDGGRGERGGLGRGEAGRPAGEPVRSHHRGGGGRGERGGPGQPRGEPVG